tara:strand:- start:1 stop:531 length:531 start_codon:yes stop_codon:yes gene_type:complete
MKKKDCYFLGKIIKKYSFKGEVLAKLDTDEPNIYKELKTVFLDLNNNLVPYFIVDLKLHKSDLLRLKFEDINNEVEANELIKKDMYLPLNSLPKLEGNCFYFHEVLGFEILDHNYGKIGILKSINDQSPQAFFEIDNDGKEILIPINDEFIKHVNRVSKTITVLTPPGLIDLYTDQ